jgi:UDP-N-acetyl-D-mannosaminuronic acid dehydrogenase
MSNEMKYHEPQTVAVLGLGYVGLPSAALLSASGITTLGIDINHQLIQQLVSGEFEPKEPGLLGLLRNSEVEGKLKYSVNLESMDAYIIAVPTPIDINNSPGMEFVLNAAEQIAKVLKPGQLVVLESTSPPGATQMVSQHVSKLRPDLDVSGVGISSVKFAYCPERVLPGNALYEIVYNERLIGGLTEDSCLMAEALYKNFTKGNIVLCTSSEAEMAKLVENSFRDVNIAFANEVARISDKLGIKANTVISLANRHPRVNILNPGVGVGGHCISVDPWFLVHAAPAESALIRQARIVNDNQPALISSDIIAQLETGDFNRVVFLGLAYKPDSDDLRESPAMEIVKEVISRQTRTAVISVEPNLTLSKIAQIGQAYGKIVNEIPEFGPKDLVVELVSHKEFQTITSSLESYICIPGFGQLPPKTLT